MAGGPGAAPGPQAPLQDVNPALLQDEYVFFLEFAATVIQRHWRGHRVRKAFYAQRRAEREHYDTERRAELTFLRRDAAARRIQAAWQSYRNRRIYQYYRNLIQFRERGDPREMMRAINPREAELMDPAAGIHVRFRLGGAFFPPLVFYKVFTHRSVADINAFGPRNYAQEISMTAKQRHNKPAGGGGAKATATTKKKKQFSGDFEIDSTLREYLKPDGTLGYRSTRGWYERVENNGWRPIAERVLLGEDAVTAATKLKRLPFFHYNPAMRREERIRRAKQRKREWLRKMYAQTTSDDPSMPQLPGSSLADLPDEELDELQVEELLEWSQHLDFHTYVSDWTSMACTLGSEGFQPTADTTGAVTLPAPDLDVRAAMVAAGVPLAPFKGGATAAAGMPVLAS